MRVPTASAVTSLRAFIRRHNAWLAVMLACTLAMKVLIPVGFMPVIARGTVSLAICPGMIADEPMAHAMPGMDHGDAGGKGDRHGNGQTPCAFAGLGIAALGSVPPAILVAAILFAFVLAARAAAWLPLVRTARLRPPLRAPPLPA